MGFDHLSLLMKEGDYQFRIIAIADAEGLFGLAKLDIQAPEFGGILLRAVGAKQIRAVDVGGPGAAFASLGDFESTGAARCRYAWEPKEVTPC